MAIVEKLSIPEVLLIEPEVHKDDRGRFVETYSSKYEQIITGTAFVQDNLSVSKKYTVRGLHWQKLPFVQGKLVSCVAGSIFDVAVDIRIDSPTFGQWAGKILTSANHEQLWIPAGFAHGFQALEDNTVVSYKCTSGYSKEHERSLLWSDDTVKIKWPFWEEAIVSGKDQEAPSLKSFTSFF